MIFKSLSRNGQVAQMSAQSPFTPEGRASTDDQLFEMDMELVYRAVEIVKRARVCRKQKKKSVWTQDGRMVRERKNEKDRFRSQRTDDTRSLCEDVTYHLVLLLPLSLGTIWDVSGQLVSEPRRYRTVIPVPALVRDISRGLSRRPKHMDSVQVWMEQDSQPFLARQTLPQILCWCCATCVFVAWTGHRQEVCIEPKTWEDADIIFSDIQSLVYSIMYPHTLASSGY